jgi:hypothetical protein
LRVWLVDELELELLEWLAWPELEPLPCDDDDVEGPLPPLPPYEPPLLAWLELMTCMADDESPLRDEAVHAVLACALAVRAPAPAESPCDPA